MLSLFNHKAKKRPDPRFVDMEGFDVHGKRHFLAHVTSPAVYSAMATGVVLSGAIPLLMGFSGLPLVSAILIAGAAGTSVAYYSQRRILRPLEALDSVAIDREGRHPLPNPRALSKLMKELGHYEDDVKAGLRYSALSAGLNVAIAGYAYAQGWQNVACVFTLVSSVHVPRIVSAMDGLIRAHNIHNKRYSFCYPPALSIDRYVELETDHAVSVRAQARALRASHFRKSPKP